MVRYFWRAVSAACIVGACSVAALARVQANQAPPAPRAAAPPVRAGTLRLAIPDFPVTIDPPLVADDENVELANLLFMGLVQLDSGYHVRPAAAYRWSISPDRKTYTFYLRRDLRFSNGDAITASDFKYSIERSLNPASNSPSAPTYLLDIKGAAAMLAGKAKSVDGIRVLDPHTLQITARWPVPYLLMELTYPTSFALDKKRLSKLGSIKSSEWYANPVSSGPYRLKSWTSSTMTLVPNKYYRAARPRLKQITISLAQLPETGLYQYVARNLDVVALPTTDATLRRQPFVTQTNMLAGDGIYMKFSAKPFDKRGVREALTLALDRKRLVRNSMGGSVTPSQAFVPPSVMGANPRLKVLPFDPHRAAALWKASGYATKKYSQMTLYYADDPAIARLARAVTRSWHKYLKLNVATHPLTANTLLAKVQSNSLPLYLSAWSADYPDPHDWLRLQWESDALNNNVRYHNPAFNKVVQIADVTWDGAKRMRLYGQAQQMLVNDAAWIPLYIPHRAVFMRPVVANLELTGYGLIPRSGNWADVQIQHPPSRYRSR